MLFDEARIYIKSGDGGNGCVSFRREKFVPLGGPNGGHGGHGGSVYMVVDAALNTLIHFRRRIHFKAERGEHGRGKDQHGRNGESLSIMVPPGTVVYDDATGDILADLVMPGQRMCIAPGGRGGRGNAAFKSSTHQAPRIAERGAPGNEHWLRLELKLIADAGIVGVPNAGKSTLLARVTAARPKIADYPFTTLEPNLGVVLVNDRDCVLADIPGLIEGAHRGAGLGDQFLRHIERCRVLIHLLNGISPDPLGDWEAINQELALFSPQLADKPQIVVLNKMDLLETRERWPHLRAVLAERGIESLAISAVTGEGVSALLERTLDLVASQPATPMSALEDRERLYRPGPAEAGFTIEREGGVWRVKGEKIEQATAMTNWSYYEAALRFQRILDAMRISEALEAAGIHDGDTVAIGKTELIWGEQEE
jgi:GTP-binding protein